MSPVTCGVCAKKVPENCDAISCDYECSRWFHIQCVGLSKAEHLVFVENVEKEWFCKMCKLTRDNLLLSNEISTLTQTASILQGDILEFKKLFDNAKKQNLVLSEMCIKKDKEIAALKRDVEFYRTFDASPGVRPSSSTFVDRELSERGFSLSMRDFPPLKLSNRYESLSSDEGEMSYDSTSRPMSNTVAKIVPNEARRTTRAHTVGGRTSTPSNIGPAGKRDLSQLSSLGGCSANYDLPRPMLRGSTRNAAARLTSIEGEGPGGYVPSTTGTVKKNDKLRGDRPNDFSTDANLMPGDASPLAICSPPCGSVGTGVKSKADGNPSCVPDPVVAVPKPKSSASISSDQDSSADSPGLQPNTSEVSENSTNRPSDSLSYKGRRVLLLSDSHGKDIGTKLQGKLKDDFNVFSICRPGARIMGTLSDVHKFANDFTEKDVVVINAGSNDVKLNLRTVLSQKVKAKLAYLKAKTNVVVVTLPPRYDRPDLNEVVYKCNKDLYENEVTEDCHFIPFNSYQRKFFTRHGQHLNKLGKDRLSSEIGKCITSLLSDIGTSSSSFF